MQVYTFSIVILLLLLVLTKICFWFKNENFFPWCHIDCKKTDILNHEITRRKLLESYDWSTRTLSVIR